MHRLLVLAPLVLITGCLAEEAPPLADVRVTWDLEESNQTPASEIETHVMIGSTTDGGQIDGEYVPGYAGDIVLTMDPRAEPVRVCVQLYYWAEDDSPLPWCDAPCLELTTYGEQRCQDMIIDGDVRVAF